MTRMGQLSTENKEKDEHKNKSRGRFSSTLWRMLLGCTKVRMVPEYYFNTNRVSVMSAENNTTETITELLVAAYRNCIGVNGNYGLCVCLLVM